MDKNSIRKFEKDLQKKIDKATERANRAAARRSTPDQKARAFRSEMKKDGVEMDLKDLRKRFES